MQAAQNFLKRPFVFPVICLILGILVGLIWGWWIDPVKFVDATPAYLRADLQEDYLRMAIRSFVADQSADKAIQRWQDLGPNAPQLLAIIKNDPQGIDPRVIDIFSQVVQQGAPVSNATPAPSGGGATASLSTWVISIAGILILVVLLVAAYIFLRRLLGKRGSGEPTAVMQATEISRNTEKTNFEDLGLAPPITQTMTTYMLGDDLYDESFSIDTQGGEFLGEYGVGVSETIGVGDPKKVTALEIWLFDKNDIKTATKVLMSSHAFSDAGIRGRLEPKGELVLVEPQKQIILETQTLQLLATVVDLQYGQGPLPANSYFERLTLELAIWPKGS